MDMTNDEIPQDHIEQAVFNALGKETDFVLPRGFADNIVAMVDRKAMQRESQRDHWWLIGGILSMVVALGYVFTAVDFSPRVGVFTFFSGYSGLVIFGVLFITALHLVDKFLLKKIPGRK